MDTWNFHNFIATLERKRKNPHGISKVDLTLKLLDFIADYEDKRNVEIGKSYKEFKRITEESTARKLWGEHPAALPRRYVLALSAKDFDLKKLASTDFANFCAHFQLNALTKTLSKQLETSDNYWQDENKQKLMIFAKNESSELFIAACLADVVAFRDNTSPEGADEQPDFAKLWAEQLDDASFNTLEKLTQEVERSEWVVQRLVKLACMTDSPLEKNDEIGKVQRQLFHLALSGFKRDIYRKQVMLVCLQTGYFAKNREELLVHLSDFTEDKHLFLTLVHLWQELKLCDDVKKYKSLLHDEKFVKQLDKIMKNE